MQYLLCICGCGWTLLNRSSSCRWLECRQLLFSSHAAELTSCVYFWRCTDHAVAIQGRSKELSGRQKLLAGAALATVLALAVAAAVRPALWALSFAFARWRRIALLGYWVALLAAALPLMDWVLRRRKVPTIIVRKVWSIAYVRSVAKPPHALE